MKTKSQKIEQVKKTIEELEKSSTLVIADFTGLSVNAINRLRKILRETDMRLSVVKKRLLKRVFDEKGITLNPKELQGQTGVVFSSKDITETCQLVYKFQKDHKDRFKMLSGLELAENRIWSGAEVERIGKLPSREVLLGQLVGMLTVPIRQFLFVLNERAKININK